MQLLTLEWLELESVWPFYLMNVIQGSKEQIYSPPRRKKLNKMWLLFIYIY